ncbi:hypothetical protein [Salidesulfovibrio onnuriiensis]|uniref:hypothetical protein n=1 Tax=Salidesulfovibrio onnuriiensis TaxID=2583823 RepID=UPI0011C83FD5|nr:hypothetical protein [Salidesulfovibrio onnuriiensis]
MKPLDDWIADLFAGAQPRCIVFRVDAGRKPGLSFGHLSRCLVLAQAARRRFGAHSVFLMRGYAEGVAHAENHNAKVSVVVGDEVECILRVLKEHGGDWLVHDLPYGDFDERVFQACRERGVKTIFVDDARFRTPGVDVLLNSSILARERVEAREGVRMLLGPDFFPLGPDDGKMAPQTPWKRTVLLTFGGSDPTGLSVKSVANLAKRKWVGIGFQVMLGPGFEEGNTVKGLVEDRDDFMILENVAAPFEYFRCADLVVCAGGRTMYELAALDIPFIAVASARHEQEPVRAFVEQGLALFGFANFNGHGFVAAVDTVLNGDIK